MELTFYAYLLFCDLELFRPYLHECKFSN